MTDEPMESGQGTGAAGLPKPTYQEPAAEPTSAVAKPSATFDIESLAPLIEELVEKKVQSTKDRRWNDLEKQFGTLNEFKQMLEAAGADPQKSEKILEGMRIQQLEQKIEQLTSRPKPIPGKSEQDEAFVKAKGIIEAAELNNNPRILEVMSGKYSTPGEMLEKLNLTVLEEVTGKPRATDASKVTPSSGQSPHTARQAEQTFNSLLENPNLDVNALIAAAQQIED